MGKETISDVLKPNIQEMSFEDRAKGYAAELEPICKKWGILPWAGIETSQSGIFPTIQIKDTFSEQK